MLSTHHIPETQTLLIVATSGRMLAQLSVNAGYKPLVIDCFSDADTQALAVACIKVNSLALEPIKTALSILQSQYTITHVIYGSGLEQNIDTLQFLDQQFTLLGNTPEIFSAIQNKPDFFSRLSSLQIAYPEISFQKPDVSHDWLIKPMQGEGGIGITKDTGQSIDTENFFWQKMILGMPMSVLFIADGTIFQIVGFQKQLITTIDNYHFIFSGLVGQPKISSSIYNTVSQWVNKLVSDYSLKGINSLDFMVNNENCYALEINARPSASMQLYTNSFISEQMNSFMGGMSISSPVNEYYQGYKIIFAESSLSIRKKIIWPEWVADIPHANSLIHTGMPICSIIVGGKSEQQVMENLQFKQRIINKLINR